MALLSWEAADRSHKNRWTVSLGIAPCAPPLVSMCSMCALPMNAFPESLFVFMFSLAEVGETSLLANQALPGT